MGQPRLDRPPWACPACVGSLIRSSDGSRRAGIHPTRNPMWSCTRCLRTFRTRAGFWDLVLESEVGPKDRRFRRIYDHLNALHDPACRIVLPVLQLQPESRSRTAYARFWHALTRREARRVLEVGVGTGVNLSLLAGMSTPSPEVVGIDLSAGMLLRARGRVGGRSVVLVLADAHRLPFSTQAFDAILSVGGLNGFSDKRRALVEMVRVLRPGGVALVVDEGLDKACSHPWFRMGFKVLTLGDRDARPPVDLLPAGVEDVHMEQVSRFYYALSFRRSPGS